MFAERLDTLMNIANVTNTMMGKAVHMNSSHLGRLRSGARPLPKKHDFLKPMCQYLAEHMKKDYQLNALQKLTGISGSDLNSPDSIAVFLEQWLSAHEMDMNAATARFISGFSHIAAGQTDMRIQGTETLEEPVRYANHLYGNAGKRKAVEQFFLMILQEKKPQTLLLFSDENMAWMYEDAAFARRWVELFIQVIMKGNRVRIIHNVGRDLNELIEAVMKWVPIYMTGMVEPYYYPRLRDGLFQRTMFIAPKTAAIISSSVQQDTDKMLNLFLTDQAALNALTLEYEHLFSYCRPLMNVDSGKDIEKMSENIKRLFSADGDAIYISQMPPLFSMPKELIEEVVKQTKSESLMSVWKEDCDIFYKNIRNYHFTANVMEPEIILRSPNLLRFPMEETLGLQEFLFTEEQYLQYVEHLRKLEQQHENLTVCFKKEIASNMMLFAKDEAGVMMAKADNPIVAFFLRERNMVNAFWDYLSYESNNML